MTQDEEQTWPYVYLRESSWASNSGPGEPTPVHWAGVHRSGTGPHPRLNGLSVCGRGAIDLDHPRKPSEVSGASRCGASGCRQRWDAYDRQSQSA